MDARHMKLVGQTEYHGYTLLWFEDRFPSDSGLAGSHWLIVAPDDINVLGSPQPNEQAARAFVDRLVEGASRSGQPDSTAGQ